MANVSYRLVHQALQIDAQLIASHLESESERQVVLQRPSENFP
jgi:hypothetical protein